MNGRDRLILSGQRSVRLEHRHFCFIAAVISELPDAPAKQSVVNAFVAACKRSNSRFDHDRFVAACNHEGSNHD